MHTWRPADATESAIAWKSAVEYTDGPSALIFSRQGLPSNARTAEQVAQIEKGGYVLVDCEGTPEVILIATGSEVELAVNSQKALTEQGIKTRVVSMPCTNLFDQQDAEYKQLVLPNSVVKRVAIEAAHVDYWAKYVGFSGAVVGMSTFGESAPGNVLLEHFGFTVENVVNTVKAL
jgi:transketolase